MLRTLTTFAVLAGLILPSRLGLAGARTDHIVAAAVAYHLEDRGAGLEPGARARLARTIVGEARARGFEPSLVLAVIEVESGFRRRAVSPSGAYGLMQVRPATGRALARRLGIPWRGAETLLDPVANVRLGVAYLAELHRLFGQLPAALAAYNWGPARIQRLLGRGAPLPAAYAGRVLEAWASLPADVGRPPDDSLERAA